MGRNAIPIGLHLATEGGKHLTQEEINARKNQEAALRSGNKKFHPSKRVMDNDVAFRMFKKLRKLYKDIEYVEGLDENVINRYCLLYAESDALEELIDKMTNDLDECTEVEQRLNLYESLSRAENSLAKIADRLLKLEDRLFLNPTARVKNVPRPKEKPKNQGKWAAYKGSGQSG